MIWRLTEDSDGVFEGSCISDARYQNIVYFNKCLWEPVQDDQKKDMLEYADEDYCKDNGLECLLFYNSDELDRFVRKNYDFGVD